MNWPAAARDAAVAVAAEPSHGDPVADGEVLDAVAELGDGSRDLVTQRDRPLQTGEVAGVELPVGAAHPARGDRDADVPAGRAAVSTSTRVSGSLAEATWTALCVVIPDPMYPGRPRRRFMGRYSDRYWAL